MALKSRLGLGMFLYYAHKMVNIPTCIYNIYLAKLRFTICQ